MITFLVLQGPDKGQRYELPEQPLVIGRESRALPLTDGTISRRHCEVRPAHEDRPDSDEWLLRDLGSSNGTYINGQRCDTPIQLKLGDQIRIGRTLMVFGHQPGMTRTSRSAVQLAGQEVGMDSAIINTMGGNDDSMVLAVPEPAAAAMSNLKILYRLTAALGTSFSTDQMLDVVMDLVFEHVQADRGIILLVESDGTAYPRVARVRDERKKDPLNKTPAEPEKIHASKTIVQHVINTGEGVLSSNAMADSRFRSGKSVHDMGIRSALCVPMKARRLDARGGKDDKSSDETFGVIYIDSSVRNYTYSTDQLRLLTAIGLQAGLALQNARLYRQQLQAERLAAIGETTAALSHSIKNILQALRGGADVVEMGLKNANLDQSRRGWGVVLRNLDKIYSLTLNLLAYSKPREPNRELVNPRKIIDECLELIAPNASERGVMALADVASDVPAVPVDSHGIHQVLMNLLTNSLDAAPSEGGVIRIACRYDEADRQTIIDVIDNGAGIPAPMMSHLFELFHSTKGNRGTGLGLAVAKKIVEEHDGVISATSKQGEGTTFTVRLPAPGRGGDPGGTFGPGARPA